MASSGDKGQGVIRVPLHVHGMCKKAAAHLDREIGHLAAEGIQKILGELRKKDKLLDQILNRFEAEQKNKPQL